MTMLGVGSVLAEESSDDLEHWIKEIFYRDGVMFSIMFRKKCTGLGL